MAKKFGTKIFQPYFFVVLAILVLSLPLIYYLFVHGYLSDFAHILIFLCCFTCLLLITLYIITSYYSRVMARDFTSAMKQIVSFNFGKDILPGAPNFSKTEIKELENFIRILGRRMNSNLGIFAAQQEFVENAAHELQTPLAIFQAKVDLLIQDPLVRERQPEVLNSLSENVSRMKRLNHNLLLLSKVNHRAYSDTERIGLNDLIAKQVDFFKEQGLAKKLHFTINLDTPSEVNANLALTEVLIQNLFMNAIRHNVEGGQVVVSTTKQGITVANTGKKALEVEKIFNRFYKSDSSETGTGLGLAIVKKIIDINHWKIQYCFQNSMHYFHVYSNSLIN